MIRLLPALIAVVLVAVACGTPMTTNSELTQMVAMARAGDYKGWASEAAPHASGGPHGMVRTFVNEPLLTALRANAQSMPAGSIAVKELYNAGAVTGYAIDWKSADGGWHFFEGYDPTFDQYYYQGTNNGCAGCHSSGRDYVFSDVAAFRDAGVP